MGRAGAEVIRLGNRAIVTARQWLVAVMARCVLGVLGALPPRAAALLAGWGSAAGYLFDRRERKRRSLDNLMRAFPEMGRQEARRTLRAVYRHFARALVDGLRFARVAQRFPVGQLLETEGMERLEGLGEKTGMLFVTGHFGHWEVLGSALPLLGYPTWSMMRGFRNPFVDRYVRRMREATGQRLLDKHGALRQTIRLLRGGEHVGFLIDQDARKHGVFVDYFGRPAKTADSPARIALRTGAPLVFLYVRAAPGGGFRLTVADVIRPRPDADADEETLRITQALTSDLEAVVRQHPEEWLWLHRRWKTYPGKYPGE